MYFLAKGLSACWTYLAKHIHSSKQRYNKTTKIAVTCMVSKLRAFLIHNDTTDTLMLLDSDLRALYDFDTNEGPFAAEIMAMALYSEMNPIFMVIGA